MIELYINGQFVDLPEEGIGIRLNNKLNDPTKLSFTQAEFSFTFDLPCTKKNNMIFGYINTPSVRNKFSRRYDASLYADSSLLFEGSFKITAIEEGYYKCNLYTPKKNTLETIFQDTKMNEFEWLVPFDGVTTINEVNNDTNSKYFFPLVAYGLFLKQPEATDASGYKYYTPKYQIDNTNKFYYSSFIPSLNMSEMMRKLTESKGYKLTGDIITDPVLSNIYLSNYIADEQQPSYNIGNPKMGSCSISFNFNTYNNNKRANPLLEYAGENYNSFVYNLLDTDNNTTDNLTVTYNNKSYMLIEDGIQIPADGWYEILTDYSMITDPYHVANSITIDTADGGTEQTTIKYSLENMPMEWQLIRYSADDGAVEGLSYEPVYNGKYNEAENIKRDEIRPTTNKHYYTNIRIGQENKGYPCITAVDNEHNPNYVVGAAISNYANTIGYAKNGKSYDHANTTNNRNLYNCAPYFLNKGDNSQTQTTEVNKNTLNNSQATTPNYNVNTLTTTGKTHNIIYLRKNDVLIPTFQQKAYYYTNKSSSRKTTTKAQYRCSLRLNLSIKAVAKENTPIDNIKGLMQTQWNTLLNLADFCNKEQKITEFFNNVIKAFNLSVQQKENNLIINKLQNNNITNTAFIDIDNRTNAMDAFYQEILLPKTIAVKFSINEQEEGLYRSAELNSTDEQLQSNNWTDYADKGYTIITVNNADDAEDITQSVDFSYNWYQPFQLVNQEDNTTTTLQIPTIALTEWFIDDYKYEEMQLHDGRSLKQRMWFRHNALNTNDLYLIDNQAVSGRGLKVYNDVDYQIVVPIGYADFGDGIVYLNYHDGNNTLLKRFFAVNASTDSNAVEVDCYLTCDEYIRLTKGALIKFNDDLYRANEIKGFDAENINPTTLILQQIN